MNRVSVSVWRIAMLLVAVSMLMWACSTKSTDPLPENAKPVVEIVNIPPTNSHFTQSPIINWYGTDVDGRVIMYEYAVVAFTDIPSDVDTTDIEALKLFAETQFKYQSQGACVPACWTIVIADEAATTSPTRQRVELVAGANPADTVKQYFFVRAVDDDDARSEIRVRIYSRNNNPPTTLIKTLPDSTAYYDLPDTNVTYKGILMEWEGEDKIDFPSEADKPEFDYFYELFGPFAEGELDFDIDWNFADGFDFDTLAAATRLVTSSEDVGGASPWVALTEQRFFDLWRNAPDSDTSRVGYFVLKVTSRDDAAVSAKEPAYKVFKAIDPKFENDILVYYPVNGRGQSAPGTIWDASWRNIVDPIWGAWFPESQYTEDDMMEYFYRVFEQAGYQIPEIVRGVFSTPNIPSKERLAKYKLYIILEDGETPHLPKAHFERISHYMDLGGNVWLWGTNPFGEYQSSGNPELKDFELLSKDRVETIPFKYFNVLAQYRGGWASSYLRRNSWSQNSGLTLPETNEDFIGAEALPGTGFPNLTVDLQKVEGTYIHNFHPSLWGSKPWMNVEFRGAPNACYYHRDIFSTPIYLYKSTFGESIPDSMRAWVTPLQGTVTGLRYDSGVFRTAVFGFSMWALEEQGAVEVIRRMVPWFLAP